jgi:hypothetical protein
MLSLLYLHIKKESPAYRISFAVPNIADFSASLSPDFLKNALNGCS